MFLLLLSLLFIYKIHIRFCDNIMHFAAGIQCEMNATDNDVDPNHRDINIITT